MKAQTVRNAPTLKTAVLQAAVKMSTLKKNIFVFSIIVDHNLPSQTLIVYDRSWHPSWCE